MDYIQWAVVAILLIVASVYAIRRVVQLINGDKDPCSGCEMKKNCQKFGD